LKEGQTDRQTEREREREIRGIGGIMKYRTKHALKRETV